MIKYLVPSDAIGIRLYRMRGKACFPNEPVAFARRSAGLDTVLRRAMIAGKVVVGGNSDDYEDYFADIFDEAGDTIESIALDRGSYRALKYRWARCRLDRALMR